MSEFKVYPRPRCCPEPRCTPIFQTPAPRSDEWDAGQRSDGPGCSWLCWGALGGAVEFSYDGVQHANDLSLCTYTPLKGVLRFQENESDWREIHRGYDMALKRLVMLRDPSRSGTDGEVEVRARPNDERRGEA